MSRVKGYKVSLWRWPLTILWKCRWRRGREQSPWWEAFWTLQTQKGWKQSWSVLTKSSLSPRSNPEVVNRTTLTSAAFPMQLLIWSFVVHHFYEKVSNVATLFKIGFPDLSKVSWSRTVSSKMTVLDHFFQKEITALPHFDYIAWKQWMPRDETWAIVTIPSSDQWLATIEKPSCPMVARLQNHWKTIGFQTKNHWKTIATNGFGD